LRGLSVNQVLGLTTEQQDGAPADDVVAAGDAS